MSVKEDLELFRKYCGSESIMTTTHINQNFEKKFSGVNTNIQINIAKLRDFLSDMKTAEQPSNTEQEV